MTFHDTTAPIDSARCWARKARRSGSPIRTTLPNRCAGRRPSSIQRRTVRVETANSSATWAMVKNFGTLVVLRAPTRARSPDAGDTESVVEENGRNRMLTSTHAKMAITHSGCICPEMKAKLPATLQRNQCFIRLIAREFLKFLLL
jgi:hypothetical protein